MAYTNNVPQGNQQIATTQPLIQANFGFIQTDAQVEHIFNGNTGPLAAPQAEGTHIQASMPNQNVLAAKPSGTDGVYYVSGGKARFYDGTSNFYMNFWTGFLTGTYTPTSESTYNNVVAIPANVFGIVYFYRSAGTTSNTATSGQFVSTATDVLGFSNSSDTGGSSTPIELNNDNSALFLQARAGSTRYKNEVYNYIVFYRPA